MLGRQLLNSDTKILPSMPTSVKLKKGKTVNNKKQDKNRVSNLTQRNIEVGPNY